MPARVVRGETPGPSLSGATMSDLSHTATIRGGGGSGPGLRCREFSGADCDYVQEADGGAAAVGYHADQVMSLLNLHMAHAHMTALSPQDRAEIRARLISAG